jgi:hypothetical protein
VKNVRVLAGGLCCKGFLRPGAEGSGDWLERQQHIPVSAKVQDPLNPNISQSSKVKWLPPLNVLEQPFPRVLNSDPVVLLPGTVG